MNKLQIVFSAPKIRVNLVHYLCTKLISPKWQTVTVVINDTAYYPTTKGIKITTINGIRKISKIIYIFDVQCSDDNIIRFLDNVEYFNKQRGFLAIIKAFYRYEYNTCSSLASSLFGRRILVPDKFYKYLKDRKLFEDYYDLWRPDNG
jgi:hypothetical protein